MTSINFTEIRTKIYQMQVNTNTWNKIRYSLYAPGYDLVANILRASRRSSIESLDIHPGAKILIVGAGTGLDLEFLPVEAEIFATDLTPVMIANLKARAETLNKRVHAQVMDGQALEYEDHFFDSVILHLILAVIPDPVACLREAERVLKPGGQIVVYDKFVPKNRPVSILRKMANLITNTLFSNITRNFESIAASTHLDVVSDVAADFNGNFRLIKLIKK